MKISHSGLSTLAIVLAATPVPGGVEAIAQTSIPASISTPVRVETRLGALEFKDGVPSKATAEKVFDNLDFTYAYRSFMDNLRGVSIQLAK